ncbi:MAG: TorF family putative porin [Polaromonas sp.]
MGLSGAAFAQTDAAASAPAASPLTFNISLASNYKFRGQDQDQSKTRAFKPALQGGVDYAFDNGFYVGNWNSTVNWTKYLPSNPSNHVEIDLYGGYKFNAGPVAMDAGALTYFYPGASGANTTELYLGAGFGPVSAKYSHTVSKGYFGIGKEFLDGEGRGTGYFNLAYAQEVMPKVTLKASLGFTNFKSGANSAGLPDYMDYSVGASYDLGNGLALSGALVGAGKKSSYLFPAAVDTSGKSINKNTLVVLLTKTL